jgi:hypothetical protein
LANHAPPIWACDFLQTDDVWFRTFYLFFLIEHGSRRVLHFAVTRWPSDAWVAQQIREATAFGTGPHFLICDNDDQYGVLFEHAVAGVHTELLHTPFQAPQAKRVLEQGVESSAREVQSGVQMIMQGKPGDDTKRLGITFISFDVRVVEVGLDQLVELVFACMAEDRMA